MSTSRSNARRFAGLVSRGTLQRGSESRAARPDEPLRRRCRRVRARPAVSLLPRHGCGVGVAGPVFGDRANAGCHALRFSPIARVACGICRIDQSLSQCWCVLVCAGVCCRPMMCWCVNGVGFQTALLLCVCVVRFPSLKKTHTPPSSQTGNHSPEKRDGEKRARQSSDKPQLGQANQADHRTARQCTSCCPMFGAIKEHVRVVFLCSKKKIVCCN